MRRKAGKIVTYIVVVGMVLIFLFDITAVLLCNTYEARWPVGVEPGGPGGTRVHFLNTGNSDCVLLESAGHFALLDSGWGSDNPNEKASRPGYEQAVVDYLKRAAGDAQGMVTLDFVLSTHYHYDHAGGFPAILNDPAIRVNRVYLRPLETVNQYEYELTGWAIAEIRQRIADAAIARGFELDEQLPTQPFQLGDMTLQLLNLDSYRNPKVRGENDNTVVVLARYGQCKALFMGDITMALEKEIAARAGQVDLLKLGHHGYSLSTCAAFIRAVKPKLAVVTNGIGQVYPNVKWNLALSGTPLLSSARGNGLIITLSANGEMRASAFAGG